VCSAAESFGERIMTARYLAQKVSLIDIAISTWIRDGN